jgi:hypothetical protein
LHPDVVAYTLKRFEEELAKALATRRQGEVDVRRQISEIERGIANQLRGLSDGYSASITAEIAKLERQLSGARDRLKIPDPQTVKLQMRHTRRFIESRLSDLSALWNGEGRLAREGIAKHVQKITLKRSIARTSLLELGIGSVAWRIAWCRGPGLRHACVCFQLVPGGVMRSPCANLTV